jgi:aminoglycoside/choline kinase family phosphotransferase
MSNSPIQWATNFLRDNRYQIHSSIPDIIQDTPWSVVYRFKTDRGLVFLKKVPPALSLEPKIINILLHEFHANVPIIIAENEKPHCFLMKDAGVSLHEYFKQRFQADILIQTMHDYTQLQIMATDKVKRFLDLKVPDWRLEQLPKLYQDLIAHETLLTDDGLDKEELRKLKQLESKLFSICEELSHYKIKETFSHADFHDKNILINVDSQKTTLIDLGEVVITHPFFSFLNCLHRAKENFSLSEMQYHHLQLTCFKPWLNLETQEHLFEILAIIQQCWSIHAVLVEFRLINSIDQTAFQELRKQGRLARNLRHWIQR